MHSSYLTSYCTFTKDKNVPRQYFCLVIPVLALALALAWSALGAVSWSLKTNFRSDRTIMCTCMCMCTCFSIHLELLGGTDHYTTAPSPQLHSYFYQTSFAGASRRSPPGKGIIILRSRSKSWHRKEGRLLKGTFTPIFVYFWLSLAQADVNAVFHMCGGVLG